MSTWLLPSADLTPQQDDIVKLSPNEHRLVLGGPGSGKTQVLVHRAAHLAETFQVPAARYRVFVFTNVIKEYIHSGLQFIGLPDEVVCTFDHWCYLKYQEHISRRLPRSGKSIDFLTIREGVLSLLQKRKDLQKSLDFVLVDEGQDLTTDVYRILALATHHLTVFIDPLQKIFENGAHHQAIVDTLGIRKSGWTLLGAYRNAPHVAFLASHFIRDEEARTGYLEQVCSKQKVTERPLCFIAGDYEEELDRLGEIIQQRQVMNERIGIIVNSNRLVHGLAAGFEQRHIHVEKAVKVMEGRASRVLCDFNNVMPKVATFHMAKGLTFDTVILPRLTERTFSEGLSGAAEETRRRLLFVGIARATQWVCLSSVRGQEFQDMDILQEAEQAGHLVIQGAEDRGSERKKRREEADEGGKSDWRGETPVSKRNVPEDDEFLVL